MMAGEASKSDVSSVTSTRWFVAGGVLSVLSAFVLAWLGTVCVEPLKILTARDASEWELLGDFFLLLKIAKGMIISIK